MRGVIMKRSGRAERHILAVDHGTSGVKVALVTGHGSIVDFAFEPIPTIFIPGGGAEQDPEEWWRAFLNASRKLLARGKVRRDRITAVSVSSTFSSTVAVDREGRALMNCLTWMDSRGAPYVKQLVKGFPTVMGYNLFKMLRWIRYTGGGPSLSGKDDIAHVLLIKNRCPEIYDATHAFLSSKDYLNLRLTGEIAATHDSVMLFWVTDTRDINNVRYSASLAAEMGIDLEKLPPLVRSVDIIGNLRSEVADYLGLGRDVRVVGGSPDHQAALVGSGALRDFEGHMYIGTSSWVECLVPFKKTDLFHSIASLPSAIPGRYQCINEQDIAGGCLSFLLKNIIQHKNEFYQGRNPRRPYELLNRMASRVGPGSDGLIFMPWLNGERTPVDSTTLRGGFYNISLATTADHFARAVLEGVAYNTRWSLRYVESFTGRRMETINIIGGGAKSSLWCQIFSDVFDRCIRQVRDPIESNARGAAFIAAVGLDWIAFDDIPDLVEYENVFEPNSSNRGIYDGLFEVFLEIYSKNVGIFDRLNGNRPAPGEIGLRE